MRKLQMQAGFPKARDTADGYAAGPILISTLRLWTQDKKLTKYILGHGIDSRRLPSSEEAPKRRGEDVTAGALHHRLKTALLVGQCQG